MWGAFRRAVRVLTACLAVAGCSAKVLNVPGRYQYDDNNGYCGEVSIQQLMLRHGAWIPQEVARSAGGGELLPGVNYDVALDALRVRYDEFTGRGYAAFMRWARGKLARGYGVVTVAYYRGGPDSDYDHVMPIVGYARGAVYVNTGYSETAVRRTVASYSCSRHTKKDSIQRAGCVPEDTRWGYAIRGPVYAGAGPRVSLAVNSPREPGVGRSVPMRGTVKIRDLTPGTSYTLSKITNLRAVPRGPEVSDRWVVTRFVAKSSTWSTEVVFESRRPAYFMCAPDA